MALAIAHYYDEMLAHEEDRRRTIADLSAFDHVTHNVDFGREDDYDAASEAGDESAQKARNESDLERSTAISSAIREDGRDTWDTRRHTIALDIDHRVRVIPSSTEGHSHLYIDVPLEWDDYARLLDLLDELGIVESGYVAASTRRRATHLRLPWVKKEPKATPLCDHLDGTEGHVGNLRCIDVADHPEGHIFQLDPPTLSPATPSPIDLLEPF